jgi:hypothetical protein
LRRAVGCGQPIARAVLVDRAAPDHRQHPVTVALCVRQSLQREQARALGDAEPVRSG